MPLSLMSLRSTPAPSPVAWTLLLFVPLSLFTLRPTQVLQVVFSVKTSVLEELLDRVLLLCAVKLVVIGHFLAQSLLEEFLVG